MQKRAIVLDCRGVLIIDKGFSPTPADIEFPHGVTEGLTTLQDFGFHLVVAMNVPEVGWGKYAREEMEDFFDALVHYFCNYGVNLSAIEACTHTPRDADCYCRKPQTRLLDRIEMTVGKINWEQSYGIGVDARHSEMMLEKGSKACLIRHGSHNNGCGMKYWSDDDPGVQAALLHPRHRPIICSDFTDAVEWILTAEAKRGKQL